MYIPTSIKLFSRALLLSFLIIVIVTDLTSAARASPDCNTKHLVDTFLSSEENQIFLEIKHLTGYLPSDAAIRTLQRMDRSVNQQLGEIVLDYVKSSLDLYSQDGQDTYLLIYSSHCVWLFHRDGMVAVDDLEKINDDTMNTIWDGLNVATRSVSAVPKKSENTEIEAHSSSLDTGQFAEAQSALQKASKTLLPQKIRSALEAVSDGSRLLILRNGGISRVPFAALKLNSQFLIDKFAIILLPGIHEIGVPTIFTDNKWQNTVQGVLESNKGGGHKHDDIIEMLLSNPKLTGYVENSAGYPDHYDADKASQGPLIEKQILLIGNPDLSWDKKHEFTALPASEKEVDNVYKILGGQKYTGPSASFSRVRRVIKENRSLRLLYFATHGVADAVNPGDDSFLALNEKHLTASSLRELSLNHSPIVVMSACETGLGKVFEGGVFGLGEEWYDIGAAQVVVSLWQVKDEGTEVLMSAFISNLKSNLDKGGALGSEFALAAAIRALKQRIPDPAIWAAFEVYGRPSPIWKQ